MHAAGPRPGPDGRVVGRGAHGARCRNRRRPCRAPAARGRAPGRDLRPGPGDAAGRDLPRRASAVRGRELRRRHLPPGRAPFRRRCRRGARDGAGQQLARPAAGRDSRQRRGRARRAPPRSVPRPALHRGRVARLLRRGRAWRSKPPRASSSTWTSSRGSRAPAARARRPSEVRELLAEQTDGDGWNYPYLVFKARKSG